MKPRKIFDISVLVVSSAYLVLIVHMLTSGNCYSHIQWGLALIGAISIMFAEGFFGAMIDDFSKKPSISNAKMKAIIGEIVADLRRKTK